MLLCAAIASQQKPDVRAERLYLERGWKLDPKNSAFALGLARLELRGQHPDRALAVLRQAYHQNPSVELALVLAENLILQNKIEGSEQAGYFIDRLKSAGLGDTVVRYLEARILVQQKKWADAIPRIEMAKAVLKAHPQLTAQLDLMRADCYGRLGSSERRVDALREAIEGGNSALTTQLELCGP